ncbi:MAG: GNAT family N-acetyltransferase [Desulfuromonadaceae bacterium]
MYLVPLEYRHHAELMEVVKIAEPWMYIHRAAFDAILGGREGFVLVDAAGRIKGAITYSDYRPGVDVIVHCTVHPDCHRKWLTKKIYTQVFDHVFVTLGLHRCSGHRVSGTLTPDTFHERLGFVHEGTIRQGARIQGELQDVFIYGMLKEDRRW